MAVIPPDNADREAILRDAASVNPELQRLLAERDLLVRRMQEIAERAPGAFAAHDQVRFPVEPLGARRARDDRWAQRRDDSRSAAIQNILAARRRDAAAEGGRWAGDRERQRVQAAGQAQAEREQAEAQALALDRRIEQARRDLLAERWTTRAPVAEDWHALRERRAAEALAQAKARTAEAASREQALERRIARDRLERLAEGRGWSEQRDRRRALALDLARRQTAESAAAEQALDERLARAREDRLRENRLPQDPGRPPRSPLPAERREAGLAAAPRPRPLARTAAERALDDRIARAREAAQDPPLRARPTAAERPLDERPRQAPEPNRPPAPAERPFDQRPRHACETVRPLPPTAAERPLDRRPRPAPRPPDETARPLPPTAAERPLGPRPVRDHEAPRPARIQRPGAAREEQSRDRGAERRAALQAESEVGRPATPAPIRPAGESFEQCRERQRERGVEARRRERSASALADKGRRGLDRVSGGLRDLESPLDRFGRDLRGAGGDDSALRRIQRGRSQAGRLASVAERFAPPSRDDRLDRRWAERIADLGGLRRASERKLGLELGSVDTRARRLEEARQRAPEADRKEEKPRHPKTPFERLQDLDRRREQALQLLKARREGERRDERRRALGLERLAAARAAFGR